MEALSPTMEEGQLVRWLKAEGDTVSNGDILAEIETDKATMELVARGEGVLRKVLLGEGATAPVGEVIAIIGGAEEDIGALVGEEDAGGVALSVAEEAPGAGEDASPAPAGGAPSPKSPPERSREEDGGSPPNVAGGGGAAPVPVGEGDERVKASPLARRMARDANLDLAGVKGSGPGGRVVKRDVEAAREGGHPGAASPAPPAGSWAEPGPRQAGSGDDYEDIPLSQMRKTIAKRLVESISPVPHFFLRITVDMTRIMEARKRVNGILEGTGGKVSINDFVLKATAEALARHPEVNAQWNEGSVRRHYRVHLAVAVAVDDGLITPVVRDANLKGLAEISREVRALAERGREKRLQPDEYTGSTFSVSNLGMYGIHEFTGVINPPEAGILAVGGIVDTPVVEGGAVAVRPIMRVTMSCDHRVVDGATGAVFLRTLKGMLEEPAAILI